MDRLRFYRHEVERSVGAWWPLPATSPLGPPLPNGMDVARGRRGGTRLRRVFLAGLALAALGAGTVHAGSGVVILATGTTAQDTGLLESIAPLFEKRTGYTLKPIAVGTGQALTMVARGEADVGLAHAPELERIYTSEGSVINRRPVMHSVFILVGPPADPAGIKGMTNAVDALRKIASQEARFVSRGDRSGTHLKELSLWKEAGIWPKGNWYIEAGQGMGMTLAIASEKAAYALSERATFVALKTGKPRLELAPLVKPDPPLLNPYHVMEANPANHRRVNAAGGRAFSDFLRSPEVQALIRSFGVGRYGQSLFVPAADKPGPR